MSRYTSQRSKGLAGFVASIVAVLAAIEGAYPGKLPIVGVVVRSAPVIGEHLPIIIAALATFYAAASSAVPAFRRLLPWKLTRPRG